MGRNRNWRDESIDDKDINHLYWVPGVEKFVVYWKSGIKDWFDYRDAPKRWPRPDKGCYLIENGKRTSEYR